MSKPTPVIIKRAFVLLIMLVAVTLFAPGSVKAEPKAGSALSTNPVTSTQIANVFCTPLIKSNNSFLSFPTWYKYITTGRTDVNGKCTVPDINLGNNKVDPNTPNAQASVSNGFNGTGILLVLLAIIDILLRLSGLIALGFIVYGGIRFVTSQGSSDGTKQARETVLNGIIGMVIATIAIAVVTFLGDKLG